MRFCLVGIGLVWHGTAWAQTWANGGVDPAFGELLAVDPTGELAPDFPVDWPYGWEDLDGDGETFQQQEQSVDIRTAYAAIDATALWVRVYVSDETSASANVRVYVFLDTDNDPTTGGGAAPAEIEDEFSPDPSAGGYDYAIELHGNGSVDAVWIWNGSAYVDEDPASFGAVGENGGSFDPILINGAEHGYLQASIGLTPLGIETGDTVVIFVRTWNPSGPAPFGDNDVGSASAVPAPDSDGDGIPDDAEVPGGCATGAVCPGGTSCVEGQCSYDECLTDLSCDPWETCPTGTCVPRPCDGDEDCGGGTCVDDACEPPGGGESESEAESEAEAESESESEAESEAEAESESEGEAEAEGEACATDDDCPSGQVCDPAALICVDYLLPPAGVTQGGACSCGVGGQPGGGGGWEWLVWLTALGLTARRRWS